MEVEASIKFSFIHLSFVMRDRLHRKQKKFGIPEAHRVLGAIFMSFMATGIPSHIHQTLVRTGVATNEKHYSRIIILPTFQKLLKLVPAFFLFNY